MSQLTHEVTPAQHEMIAELKKNADIAQALLNNAIGMVIAGVAPVGSKLVNYDNGKMTIEIPETKIVDSKVAVGGSETPARTDA